MADTRAPGSATQPTQVCTRKGSKTRRRRRASHRGGAERRWSASERAQDTYERGTRAYVRDGLDRYPEAGRYIRERRACGEPAG